MRNRTITPRGFDANSFRLARLASVIVAENERELRDYYRRVIPHLGYHLIGVAENGEELIQLCTQVMPDLIICDTILPDMSGPEAVQYVLHREPVMVIYVTENQAEDRIAAGAACGAVIAKPFRLADLSRVIKGVFARSCSMQH